MRDVLLFAAAPAELADPVIGEARERQRKRRLRVAGTIAVVAVVIAVLFVTSHEWGVPLAAWHTSNGDLIRRDVRATVVNFDNSLAAGDYTRACGLLDPVSGQGVLRRVTNAVGIHGSCETRLGAVARIVGGKRLTELTNARIYDIQFAGSPKQFGAHLEFNPKDTSWAGYIPSVGLGRNAPNVPVTISCAPLICAGPHVLQNYIDENRAWNRRPTWVNNGAALMRQNFLGAPTPDSVTWGVAATKRWITLRFATTETCTGCTGPPGSKVKGRRETATWDPRTKRLTGFSVYAS